jgi:lantibiotic biosynthesis protein
MSSDDEFLDAAVSIAKRIVSNAVWHDGLCAWMGATLDPSRPWRAKYSALGPNLYDGTAGVGLFLAQLADLTADAEVRRTAIGALRHAVARAPAVPPDRRDGFHRGSLGIAWATARAAVLLNEEELRASARTVLTTASPESRPDRCPDVVMGSAGAILGLLALADSLDDPDLIRDALGAGEGLMGAATVTRHGWSWAIPGRRYPHHLCGISHGAAGIGWALLELFAVTGDERFRAGATGAFDYERSWLDADSGAWPDLRIGEQERDAEWRIASPAIGTWCYGEAGIALTRLRAMGVIGHDACRFDAEVALGTTRRHLAGTMLYDIEDLSLCHGAAGAADALLSGAAALGGQWREAADLAADFGRTALERHAANDAWPCGVAGGTTPALFRGISGIAWWLLRLHNRAIPSPLSVPISWLTAVRAEA